MQRLASTQCIARLSVDGEDPVDDVDLIHAVAVNANASMFGDVCGALPEDVPCPFVVGTSNMQRLQQLP